MSSNYLQNVWKPSTLELWYRLDFLNDSPQSCAGIIYMTLYEVIDMIMCLVQNTYQYLMEHLTDIFHILHEWSEILVSEKV